MEMPTPRLSPFVVCWGRSVKWGVCCLSQGHSAEGFRTHVASGDRQLSCGAQLRELPAVCIRRFMSLFLSQTSPAAACYIYIVIWNDL